MRQDLLERLAQYQPFDATEAQHLAAMRAFASTHTDCCERSCVAGHVTASAWILAPDRRQVLLVQHKKLNRWLQPGGHLEQDADIVAAAMREAREESGLQDLRLLSDAIFDLDVHPIPARGTEAAHHHHDVRFLLQADSLAHCVREESHALAWVALDQLADYTSSASILRMAAKTPR